jgi:hypothetical protein
MWGSNVGDLAQVQNPRRHFTQAGRRQLIRKSSLLTRVLVLLKEVKEPVHQC